MLSQPPRGSWAPTPLYYHEGGRGRALLDPLLSQGGIFGSLGYWAAGLRCIGYLSCPSRASVRLCVCAHLFWRNHPPTTLIFNKDPPPSSSQHDRRRRQSRQHSFSSSPGRADFLEAALWRSLLVYLLTDSLKLWSREGPKICSYVTPTLPA